MANLHITDVVVALRPNIGKLLSNLRFERILCGQEDCNNLQLVYILTIIIIEYKY